VPTTTILPQPIQTHTTNDGNQTPHGHSSTHTNPFTFNNNSGNAHTSAHTSSSSPPQVDTNSNTHTQQQLLQADAHNNMVCHNEVDLDVATRVHEALTEMGLITYFDAHENKLETQIRTGIEKTSLVLLFISKSYVSMLTAGGYDPTMDTHTHNGGSGSADTHNTHGGLHSTGSGASLLASMHTHLMYSHTSGSHHSNRNMNQVEYTHALDVLGPKRIIPIVLEEEYNQLYRLPECFQHIKTCGQSSTTMIGDSDVVCLYDDYEFDTGITQLIDIVYANIRPLRASNWRSLTNKHGSNLQHLDSNPTHTQSHTNSGSSSLSPNTQPQGSSSSNKSSPRKSQSASTGSLLSNIDSKYLSKKARQALESYKQSSKQRAKVSRKLRSIKQRKEGEQGKNDSVCAVVDMLLLLVNFTNTILSPNSNDFKLSLSSFCRTIDSVGNHWNGC
jgi:hypothetical protein